MVKHFIDIVKEKEKRGKNFTVNVFVDALRKIELNSLAETIEYELKLG